MMKKKTKDKEKIIKDEYNFVLYVPEITHDNWKQVDGRVLLTLKIKPITKLSGFLAKKEPIRDMMLDEMCSSAWLLIDGERSIYEIARIQATLTDDEFKEDLRRLIEFIKYTSKQGWTRYKKVKCKGEIKFIQGT